MKEVTVTYTEAEANEAIRLYDLATKSQGLQVAASAVTLTVKLQQAFQKPAEALPSSET